MAVFDTYVYRVLHNWSDTSNLFSEFNSSRFFHEGDIPLSFRKPWTSLRSLNVQFGTLLSQSCSFAVLFFHLLKSLKSFQNLALKSLLNLLTKLKTILLAPIPPENYFCIYFIPCCSCSHCYISKQRDYWNLRWTRIIIK